MAGPLADPVVATTEATGALQAPAAKPRKER